MYLAIKEGVLKNLFYVIASLFGRNCILKGLVPTFWATEYYYHVYIVVTHVWTEAFAG